MKSARVFKRVVIALLFMTGLVFSGARDGYTADPVIKIGVGCPITGTAAEDGQMIRDGAIMAVEAYKSKIKNIELVIEDDKSEPKEGAAIANKFAGDKAILGVVGHYNSSVTLAAAPILTKATITQISPGSSSPKITGFSNFLFRTQPTDALSAVSIVNWASKLGYKKAAVIYEETDFGHGLAHEYEILWPKDGRQIVVKESYQSGKTVDFSAILTKVKNSGADVALMGCLYNEGALIAKQSRQIGLKIPFFGEDSQISKAFLELGGAAVEEWRSVGAYDPKAKNPLNQDFVKAFMAKFNKEPNSFAAQSYDATALIIEGIIQKGADRAKVHDYVFNVKDFPGVSGKTSFVKGDASKQMAHFIVKDGAWVSAD